MFQSAGERAWRVQCVCAMDMTRPQGGSRKAAKDKMVRVYVPTPILEELMVERERLDRPISWILQRAWLISREKIRAMGVEDAAQAAARPTVEATAANDAKDADAA